MCPSCYWQLPRLVAPAVEVNAIAPQCGWPRKTIQLLRSQHTQTGSQPQRFPFNPTSGGLASCTVVQHAGPGEGRVNTGSSSRIMFLPQATLRVQVQLTHSHLPYSASPQLPSGERGLLTPTFYVSSGPLHQESLRALSRQRPRLGDAGTFREDPCVALHGIFTGPEHSWSRRATASRVQCCSVTIGPDKRSA